MCRHHVHSYLTLPLTQPRFEIYVNQLTRRTPDNVILSQILLDVILLISCALLVFVIISYKMLLNQ